MELVASFNNKGSHQVYPGSPFIIQRLLGGRDKLKLFEIHPTDARTLAANIAQLEAGRQVAVLREDGFEALKKFLPPPARRALVLCDPSYEIKTDYARVVATVADALQRFATGTYVVWYPLIPRPEAHDVPRKLKTLYYQGRQAVAERHADRQVQQAHHRPGGRSGAPRIACQRHVCDQSAAYPEGGVATGADPIGRVTGPAPTRRSRWSRAAEAHSLYCAAWRHMHPYIRRCC